MRLTPRVSVVCLLIWCTAPGAIGQLNLFGVQVFPLSGLGTAEIAATSAAGFGGSILAGAALGAVAAKATNQFLGRGRRRGRRQIESSQPVANFNQILKMLDELDKEDCGKRYLCEIGATPAEERDILGDVTFSMFQKSNAEVEEGDAFFGAMQYGYETKDVAMCFQRYVLCSVSRKLYFGKNGYIALEAAVPEIQTNEA
eukprot:TRINITY_DN24232_c0_g1_i1.p1 TRINITY_DN24232_c0_g1~~TRINITY_DN24232_c0_g1_i1.p1  ORF type:complete len:207 (+),score=25.10 TRINITY_DN24232_c0_g1_i1:23-622(+)